MSKYAIEHINATVDHYDDSAPIRVWVGNLGLYNEGYLCGEWLSLPATDDEIEACFERVGIADDHNVDEFGTIHDEYLLNDYESDINGLQISEYSDIETLNNIAKQWCDIADDDYKRAIIAARMENGDSFDEALNRCDDGAYVHEDFSIKDAIISEIDEFGVLEDMDRETLEMYFDYDAYARDREIMETWIEVDVNGKSYQVNIYD